MATIADCYITDMGLGTQVLLASNIDLDKAIVSYHPTTKDSFIVWRKDSNYLSLSRLRSGLISSVDIATNGDIERGAFSVNGSGDKGLLLYMDSIGGHKVAYIDLELMSISSISGVFYGGASDATRVVWTGLDEQYYLSYFSYLRRYNAATNTDLYSNSSFTANSMCVRAGKIYIVDGQSLRRLNDTGSAFSLEVSKVGVLTSTGRDITTTPTKVVVLQSDNKIHYRDLDLENPITVDLAATYNLSNPTSLVTETSLNRIGFSATDNVTGKRNFYELKSDDSVELIAEDAGAWSSNNDFCGTQLQIVS